MGDIFTKLKQSFQNGGIPVKLIYINAGVFLMIRLVGIICLLLSVPGIPILDYLELPSSIPLLLQKPWTLLTYMFTHFDFLHILFNMLWLYWFGHIFLQHFNERQLGGLYILGGLAGAFLYILLYNTLPYFRSVAPFSALIGASASVMAIVFAISFYRKDIEIQLFLIGRIKLIYLAIGTLIIDFLAIASDNAGGHIAHIGGALLGIFYATQMNRGKDFTKPINKTIDWFVNLRKPKPKMRVSYKRNETDYEYNERKNKQNAEIDRILEKLKHAGYNSLSSDEKKKLFDASK
ncbi:MAG: rhomboid family intramembrane serine protease [Massilibacteroides sp.]|nr:rhomboid family intramembrane serine protease [Massilibacteroides sp.]MDD3062249.1 rhomboid family intramembrane serine protease [Massilibacteroides sp.]MDD4114012.1 rhomboid family intramembrane serine protease [Massilibacteroides sp.]MDD4660022.1 rhomboid family intramembrane serine protease [Massilibacteroides sp.]